MFASPLSSEVCGGQKAKVEAYRAFLVLFLFFKVLVVRGIILQGSGMGVELGGGLEKMVYVTKQYWLSLFPFIVKWYPSQPLLQTIIIDQQIARV